MGKPFYRQQHFLIFAVLLVLSAGLYFLPAPPRVGEQAGRRVRAQVLEVDDSLVEQHGYVRFGPQKLKVKILSGERKGEIYEASNELRAQLELDKMFKPGDVAMVNMQDGDVAGKSNLIAQDLSRTGWTLVLFGVFCAFLVWFGAWTGLMALFSFVFSCLCIWKLVIPMILLGWPASWSIFICVVILTAAIMYLVAGVTRKGHAAFLGAIAGVFGGLLMAHVFTRLILINGAVLPYAQTLVFSGYEFIDLQDVFIGAMILASSGAVMDLGMDIASGVEEVHIHNPELPCRKLIASGLRIGRSVVGTMTTTLLLAYSGGYITLLMMFVAQGTSPWDILNNPLVASEVVKTLIGSFSLLLVAPFTAVVAGIIYSRKRTT